MRTRFLIAGIVVLAALVFWARLRDNPIAAQRADRAATVGDAAGVPRVNGKPTPSHATTAAAAKPRASAPPPPFAPPDEAALIEVDKVSLMIRDYRTLAGENPVGTNAEIMAAVMGGNPKQATLGPPEGMTLNEQGELIDRLGTPYFFHQLSRDQMEIRSAGADKVMWTDDDAITK